MRYIEDLRENEHIIEHYLCKQKQNLKTRSGKTYLSLRLMDKTGTIDAKVWEMNNDIQSFEEGDMVKIDGNIVTFQNELQLKVNKLRRSREGEYTAGNYIPMTDKDIDVLYGQVQDIIKSISHPHIRQLLENILVNDKEQAEAFKTRSAAKQMHHAYMGGLLEHTLSVAQICDFMSSRYKHLNRDLLMASALLHDIGKIYELSEMPINDYTDDGQM
ncbi:MAG: OB-fold nucleic acid binding domain-containing protein, partial [Defluviitaleaceae bacterium]|nr:OB-fold nucleic acid binding domain-containing protein [Defluviitaleaceae bacterium]